MSRRHPGLADQIALGFHSLRCIYRCQSPWRWSSSLSKMLKSKKRRSTTAYKHQNPRACTRDRLLTLSSEKYRRNTQGCPLAKQLWFERPHFLATEQPKFLLIAYSHNRPPLHEICVYGEIQAKYSGCLSDCCSEPEYEMAETVLAGPDEQVTNHFKYSRPSQMLLSKDLNIPSDLTRKNIRKPMNESRINPNADDLTERI